MMFLAIVSYILQIPTHLRYAGMYGLTRQPDCRRFPYDTFAAVLSSLVQVMEGYRDIGVLAHRQA